MRLKTRRVHIAGISPDLDDAWMAQIARNLTDARDGFLKDVRHLVVDRDPLYTEQFKTIPASGAVELLKFPPSSPNLNAFAERWVRSIKEECLDRVVPLGERHLRHLISEYVEHFHTERNHQGLANVIPFPETKSATFADGLGRIIQTKKSLARDVGGGVTTGMAVSGAVVFDAFGRLSLQGQPFFDLNSPTTFVPSTLSNTVTHDLYDVMDRVVSTALLDTGKREAVTISTTSYGFDKLGSSTYRATTIKDANVNEPSIMSGPALPGFAREELRDVRGNVIEVKQTNRLSGPLGAATPLTTFYGYDGLQQLLSVTDAKGNVTRAVYDTAGRMVTLISPDMGRTDFEHDLSGNLAKKQTAKLAAKVQFVKYQYDFNRLREVDYPTSPAVKYTYGAPAEAGPVGLNRAGRVKQETSEAGTKTYEYDALGNMNLETFSLLKVGAAGTQTTDFVTETLGYDYDSFGRLLRIFYPGPAAEVVSYGYDGGGNLDTVSGVTQNGATTPYLTHIGYDEFGQKELLVSGNGIKTTYGYDPNTRRLTQISASELDPALVKAKAAARPFQEMVYSYDPVGNITQILNNAPFDPRLTTQVRVGPVVENFTYDDLYQLATVDGIAQTASTSRAHFGLTMNYDAISNAVHKAQSNAVDTLSSSGTVTNTAVQSSGTYTSAYTYAGPRPHAPTEVDDTVPAAVSSTPVKGAFTYDPSGNESGWTRKSSSATTARQLVFDEENRLTQITRNGEELQASLYDGSGQRAVKRANDSTQTAYFGPNLTVRDGAVLTKHIFAGDMRIATKLVPDAADEQCATCNDRPSVLYFHSDQLGSTSFVSDATQALVAHEEYYPSGELWVDQTNPAPGMPQPYLFNGKELDTETGLYYYGARYYDPRVQIWISPDPILAEYMQGRPNGGVFLPRNLGLYTYAWNAPVANPDPNGECPWCGAAVGAVAGGVGAGISYAFTAPTSLSWGQFFHGAEAAIGGGVAYGATVGAIATVNPQAAFAFIGATQVKDEKDLWKLALVASLATGGGATTLARTAANLEDAPLAAETEIPTIGGRLPINSKYAGGTHPSGIEFTEQEFPDFSPHSVADVELKGLTGDYGVDSRLANEAMGYPRTPEGYTWHHVEDGRTLQLVPQEIHQAVRHTGGAAVIRNGGFDP